MFVPNKIKVDIKEPISEIKATNTIKYIDEMDLEAKNP